MNKYNPTIQSAFGKIIPSQFYNPKKKLASRRDKIRAGLIKRNGENK